MNVTDLMIGDLVYANKKPIHVTGATMVCNVQGLQTIPLTPEILEHSLFERRKGTRVSCYDLRQDKATVYLEEKDPEVHEWLCVIGRHFPTSWRCRIEMRVHDVHELQHALKLCGVEKEIVL